MGTDWFESGDRRRRIRFDLRCDLRYTLLDLRGLAPVQCGKTINISSKGAVFATTGQLPLGKMVELTLCWPLKNSDRYVLTLIARGRVIRSSSCEAAVRLVHHELRTDGFGFVPRRERVMTQASVN